MRLLGFEMSDAMLNEMLSIVDFDNSGEIDWEEFLHAIAESKLDSIGNGAGGRAFKVQHLAQLNPEELASQLARSEKVARSAKKKLKQTLNRAQQIAKGTSTKELMKWAKEEAQKVVEDKVKERQRRLKDGQKQAAVRQAALQKLKSDCSAINGWRIRVQHHNELKNEVVNFGSGVVKSCAKARLGRPRVFTVLFDEGGVGDEKKGERGREKKGKKQEEDKKDAGVREMNLVLDCDDPNAGQQCCRGGKWV